MTTSDKFDNRFANDVKPLEEGETRRNQCDIDMDDISIRQDQQRMRRKEQAPDVGKAWNPHDYL